jgi:hypothetical protein
MGKRGRMRIYEAKLPDGKLVRKGTYLPLAQQAWMKVQLCKKYDEWIALEVAAERSGVPGVFERDDDIARIRWSKCTRIA